MIATSPGGVPDRFIGVWRLAWLEEPGADGTVRRTQAVTWSDRPCLATRPETLDRSHSGHYQRRRLVEENIGAAGVELKHRTICVRLKSAASRIAIQGAPVSREPRGDE